MGLALSKKAVEQDANEIIVCRLSEKLEETK